MKKVILLILVSILLLLAFTSCKLFKKQEEKECEHEWTAATCQAAQTCTLCGVTEGKPLNHKTKAPTCTTPEMCSVCGYTTEFWKPALGHDWIEASCLTGTAKTCRTCKIVEGDVPDHTWVAATCTEDSYCEVCHLIEKESALGHNRVTVAAVAPTCTSVGYSEYEKCDRCGDVEKGKEPTKTPALEHKGYEVNVPAVPATCETTGLTSGKQCAKCGEMTSPQLEIPALGHQRYTYSDNGDIIGDGFIETVYPAGYEKCEADGITYFTCSECNGKIGVVEPKVSHKYEENATCLDDAFCEYCGKGIEHEYLDPTCTDPAKCRLCGEELEGSVALGHDLSEASCLAPATCKRGCGYTEGEKLLHNITLTVPGGTPKYSCSTCNSTYSYQDEYYYYNGSTHENMVPVNNKVGGYDTEKDVAGEPTNMPKVNTDNTGNKYYSLIKVKDPEGSNPPQLQLWLPQQRNGFTGFNMGNSAVGFLSFDINAYMDKNFSITFVEGAGWSDEEVIKDFFKLVVSTDEEGTTLVKYLSYGDELELFSKDITGVTDVNEKFTGWVSVGIGIVLDDATGSINLHYYIDGLYVGTVSMAMPTAGGGIKCIYISGNTNEVGSGLMFDDLAFGYTAVGYWPFDTDHTHSYTAIHEQVDPTCISDGYRIYKCSDENCGAIGGRVAIPALGHSKVIVGAKDATCTEDGHNEYSYCSRENCGASFVEKEVYVATGHNYKTFVSKEPTCTEGGRLSQQCQTCGFSNAEKFDPLGHEYLLTDDCNESAVCQRCNAMSTENIGHDYAPATCTEPATCRREGCGATSGEPLGHDMADANCTVASTCTVCGHTEGVKLPHVINHKYVKSTLTYYCELCDISYSIEKGYFLNGTDHSNMVGLSGNSNNYAVKNNTQLPVITGSDNYYQLLNTSGIKGQLQLWIPGVDSSNEFGFSSANNAVGFLSFKINVNMDGNFDIKLVDGLSNSGSDRWRAGGLAGHLSVSTVSEGKVTFKLGTVDNNGQQVNTQVLATPTVNANNFSGWVDIKLGIVLDPYSDQITYHCYVDGEYVVSFSAELTTKTNSINCIYITGNTTAKNSGLMFDDFAFGYTANGEWIFDTCNHTYGEETVVPATCTTYGYTEKQCSTCNYICIDQIVDAFGHTESEAPTCELGSKCGTCGEYYGEALGHTGGSATCQVLAVCDTCGKSYGEYQHDIVDATCAAASYCTVCEEVFGEAVSHNPVVEYADEKIVYSCKYCDKEYRIDNAYYQDGENAIGGAIALGEDASYGGCNTDDGNYKFVLQKAPASNGKAWVWVPTNGTGTSNNFDNCSTTRQAVGVISFTLDAYVSQSFQVHLIDTDYRGGGPAGSFWEKYTMQGIFSLTAPADNVVTAKGWGGEELAKFEVTDENKYTGAFDVAIGFELTADGKIIFHYYINGAYVTSVTGNFGSEIASGRFDGVAFLGESKVVGTGYTLDNVAFGYSLPSEDNPAPKQS